MPIDEIKFGEMSGKLDALAGQVGRMSAAIIPAMAKQDEKLDKYIAEIRARQDKHEENDRVMHQKFEEICEPIADILEWKNGDGTAEDLGAKKTLNKLVTGSIKRTAWVAGVGSLGGAIVAGLAWAVEIFKK